MSLRFNSPSPLKGDAFKECKLGREKYAKVLTEVIESYSDGFVLAINNKWGEGKSTFVKMWQQQLSDAEFKTIYFNAWENDFEDSPMVALLGELKGIVKIGDTNELTSLLHKGAILAKNVAPAIIKSILGRYIDLSQLAEVVEGGTKGLAELFEAEVEHYAEKKKGINEFKTELSAFVEHNSNEKPLIFIIDELDRCRPDYAVAILEKVKHFFSIPNIIFVLSIDKTQLGNAVRGVYGSENLDADEYLRRFIDIEYQLPSPDNFQFCMHLFEQFDFQQFFEQPKRKFHSFGNEKDAFISYSAFIFDRFRLSLRQQQSVFALAKIALKAYPSYMKLYPGLLIFLICLKNNNEPLFEKILNKKVELHGVLMAFKEYFSTPQNKDYMDATIRVEAQLIFSYANYLGQDRFYHFLKTELDEQGNFKNQISQFDESPGQRVFKGHLDTLQQGDERSDFSIDILLKRININENFVI